MLRWTDCKSYEDLVFILHRQVVNKAVQQKGEAILENQLIYMNLTFSTNHKTRIT
jgi:hypothetical protein